MNSKYTLIMEMTGHGVLMNVHESTVSSTIVITIVVIIIDSYRIEKKSKNNRYTYVSNIDLEKNKTIVILAEHQFLVE